MISLRFKTTTKRKRWLREKCGVELHNADMSLWLIAFVQREAELNFLLLLRWIYCDEQTQQCEGLTDGRQLRWRGSRGGRIWLDRCPKLRSRGTTPLPHRRKSSENVPLPGSHRWAIRWEKEGGRYPSSPRPPPPLGPVCPRQPATRLICQAKTSSC